MRVFVTGASGYIGHAVSRAFRAKGHTVYGLVRNQENANLLSLDEIWPVIGDMDNPDSYAKILNEVEVVAHCAFERSNKGVERDRLTIDTLIGAFSNSTLSRSIIYTSGVWVYGSTGINPVDESYPLNPIDIGKWRPEHEKLVLDASTDTLRTIVLRPGCVYGNVGGLTNLFFTSTSNGSVTIVGEGHNHWAMIHVQDLAYAYVAAAEKELSRVILNVVDDSNLTVREMAEAVARSAGLEGKINVISPEEGHKQFGDLIQGLLIDQKVNNARLKRLLGWQIHHDTFVNDIAIYYNAWSAAQNAEVF